MHIVFNKLTDSVSPLPVSDRHLKLATHLRKATKAEIEAAGCRDCGVPEEAEKEQASATTATTKKKEEE